MGCLIDLFAPSLGPISLVLLGAKCPVLHRGVQITFRSAESQGEGAGEPA